MSTVLSEINAVRDAAIAALNAPPSFVSVMAYADSAGARWNVTLWTPYSRYKPSVSGAGDTPESAIASVCAEHRRHVRHEDAITQQEQRAADSSD